MKKMDSRLGRVAASAALALSLFSAPKASADFFYHFSNVFSGTSPSDPAPWIDAFFHDVSPGTVDLTITASGLATGEFMSGIYINLNPNDAPTSLSFTKLSTTGSFSLPTISEGVDSFKADGDGKYDVLFSFGTANSTTFSAGDSITYKITGVTGLTAMDFDYLSLPAGGHGPFLSAAHIQGICTADGSAWVSPTGLTPVPEPTPAVLLSVALGVFGGARWLKARAKKS